MGHFVAQWCVTVFLVLDVSSVDTQHISSTPILGLCHGVFTDQFIFRLILGHFFPTSYTFYATGETRSITSHTTCNTKNVICMVQCNRCNLQYTGETKRRLKDRFNEHRRAVGKTNIKSKPTTVSEHFLSHLDFSFLVVYLERRFNGGFFCVTSLGSLYLEGLIHEGAYFRNFTISHERNL